MTEFAIKRLGSLKQDWVSCNTTEL